MWRMLAGAPPTHQGVAVRRAPTIEPTEALQADAASQIIPPTPCCSILILSIGPSPGSAGAAGPPGVAGAVPPAMPRPAPAPSLVIVTG
jgi:hypothetical protein